MDYRQIFKQERITRNMTQEQVAKICAVSDATVGHWENCKRDMRIDCIIKLCLLYNISANYIFGISKIKELK